MGEMSLVGPRPERPQFVEKFKEEIPRYMIKHQVRPGLTGWAQINGYRGDTSIRKRIEYDLFYIENWSMSFDIKIMFLTIFCLIFLSIFFIVHNKNDFSKYVFIKMSCPLFDKVFIKCL
jgi:lipopolysaccharide/colanic/teichoic acid biosynthesis glycosyltransferase